MRAVRLTQPLKVDGRLDEEVYTVVPGAGGFIQQEPLEGQPSTDRTEVWVLFDDTNLYVAAKAWDEHPERWVLNELQRDGNVSDNENLTVAFDMFHDHRNGFGFQTSPLGVLRDLAFTDEGNLNENWNTVWDVKGGRFDGGWTVEIVVPFKSLRYRGSGAQVWSINFRRVHRWKNEMSYLTAVPASYGQAAVFRMSHAADLVGLETPAQSMNLEVKPYVVSSLTTDRSASSAPRSNDLSRSAGIDLKYGLTRSLTADFTYNTDFAQAEEDLQQVNLTRFNLFFPEKREFFLEGQGIFSFGGTRLPGGRGGGGSSSDVPILFFSRRIGLSQGQAVPVTAGGRVTGKVGRFDVGALNIQTEEDASANALATNFSVVRLKRDVLRRSSIGVLATSRKPTSGDAASNLVFGVDTNMLFFDTVTINAYYAGTQTPGRRGDESSYRGRVEYAIDRYGLDFEHLMVGDDFNPEVGFTRRNDFRRNTLGARFSPRVRSSSWIRKLNWRVDLEHIASASTQVVENTQAQTTFRVDFNNSDQWTTQLTHEFEYLPESFDIARGIEVPSGDYRWQTVRTEYHLGPQRPISGWVYANTGTFYGGRRTQIGFNNGRVSLSPHLSFEPGITLNWVDLPYGDFVSRLIAIKATVTPSPRMVIGALTQYNSAQQTLSSSVRLRWEYTPGSELFVVYTDGRDTSRPGAPALVNHAIIAKVTRLLRF